MINIADNISLKSKNTFGIDAGCRRWIEFTSADDLPVIFSEIPVGEKWKVIGGGSNLLFTKDFDGSLLHSVIKGIEIDRVSDSDDICVRVGSGEILDEVIGMLAERSIWGLENLSGIPGETGAGAVQNVGAYGVEIKDCIESVEAYDVVDKVFRTISLEECRYAYRDSLFKSDEARGRYVITAVNFRMSYHPSPKLGYGSLDKVVTSSEPTPSEVRDAVIAVRASKLPDVKSFGSAGSYFKNPVVDEICFDNIRKTVGESVSVPHFFVEEGVKIPAAWLIDQCGWKGREMGNAGVWYKQPLILINLTGDASSSEIIALEEAIVDTVKKKFNITLSTEVEKV